MLDPDPTPVQYAPQKPGERRYYPPIPRPTESLSAQIERTNRMSSEQKLEYYRKMTMDINLKEKQRQKKEALEREVRNSWDTLSKLWKSRHDPTATDVHLTCTTLNHIRRLRNRGTDPKTLGRVLRFVVMKKRNILPYVKAYVIVHRWDHHDAEMYLDVMTNAGAVT